MSLNRIKEYLFSELEGIDIVDTHEHLAPEKERVKLKVDVCTLFSHYTRNDFISAGMKVEDYECMINTELPLDERVKLLLKYLPYIKYGSYARAAFIALRDIYGYEKITMENYKEISEKMKEFNKPGIYDEILAKKCRAKAVLTQAGRTDYEKKYMIPVLWADMVIKITSKEDIEKRGKQLNMEIRTLQDYLTWMRERLLKWKKEERVVGIKTVSLPRKDAPSPRKAEIAFNSIMKGRASDTDKELLNLYLFEELLKLCGELELVVAVHSGVWGDFRRLDPTHMIPYFARFPETKFDLYHMGMPYVRETAFIGKNYPNVYLNLCWSHIVSPYMTRSALLEYIDIVPVNKIMAYGGDYNTRAVEKAWGHLVIAKENIAQVLATLVVEGRVTKEEAVELAKMWFYDNPMEIYRLRELVG